MMTKAYMLAIGLAMLCPSSHSLAEFASQKAELVLWLRPKESRIAELEKAVDDVANIHSQKYAKYWSSHQIGERFGADKDTISHAMKWANTRFGNPPMVLSPTKDALRLMVPHAHTLEPIANLPYSVRLTSAGHHNKRRSSRRHPSKPLHRHTPTEVNATWPFPTGTPSNQLKAYGIPEGTKGQHGVRQMVWGTGTFGFFADDLKTFWESENVDNSLDKIIAKGYSAKFGGDNAGEGQLDTTVISSIAPGITTYVYNSNQSTDTETATGFGYAQLSFLNEISGQEDDYPHVLSLSLGSVSWAACDLLCREVAKGGHYTFEECTAHVQNDERQVCMYANEDVDTLANEEFMKLALKGITVLAATGDGGMHFSFQPFKPNEGLNAALNVVACQYGMPTFPASSPYVLAVGGVSWKVTRGGSMARPVYWPGGGSGFSWKHDAREHQGAPVQSYLKKYNGTKNFPSASAFIPSKRAYPDVAGLAEEVPVQLFGKLMNLGGTSASTPSVAAVFALLNDMRIGNELEPLGWVNPRLYDAASKHSEDLFVDIEDGNSAVYCTEGFPAGKSWDPVTGWGALKWAGLVEHLGK